MLNKQHVDLTTKSPMNTDKLTVTSTDFGNFVPSVGAWKINPNVTHFKLNLDKQYETLLRLSICMPNGLKFQFNINGENFGEPYNSNNMGELFIDLIVSLPKYALKEGENFISICLVDRSDICYLRACSVDIIENTYNITNSTSPKNPKDYSDWLKGIQDEVLLSDLNLPGTHDSAAIDEEKWPNTFACQNITIREQLRQGIRIIDIRLKAKKVKDTCELFTCHGKFNLPGSEFQSFESVICDCKDFLSQHKDETIIMSLKFDNWGDYKKTKDIAKETLKNMLMLNKYVGLFFRNDGYVPNLDDARGKIYLLNRIDDNLDLGVPIQWKDNTEGISKKPKPPREFKFYVQDKWRNLKFPFEESKFEIVKKAWSENKTGEPLISFASATIHQLLFTHSNQLHKIQNMSDLSTPFWQGNNAEMTHTYLTSPSETIFYDQNKQKDPDVLDLSLMINDNKSQMLTTWLKKTNKQTNIVAVPQIWVVCIHNKFLQYWKKHGCNKFGWSMFDYPNLFNITNEKGETITVIDVIIDSNKRYLKTKTSVHFPL